MAWRDASLSHRRNGIYGEMFFAAATAGSIVGAVVGFDAIPKHWYKSFHNTIHSYLTGQPKFRIDDLARRFKKQAERVFA